MNLFQTILIPVDFTLNTEVAISKALDLADSREVVIHLLHITKPGINDVTFGKSTKTEKIIEAEIRLNEWKQSIEEYLPFSKVLCWIESYLSIEQGIVDKSFQLSPDLIVVGKTTTHSLLPLLNTIAPSKIAKKTSCAVLTVKPGSLNKKIKHAIVPVGGDDLLDFKVDIVKVLCKKRSMKISLVAFLNNENAPADFSASVLLQAFQKLKAIANCQVEYAVLHGNNRGKAILQFAESNQADVLLLQPYIETKIGWPDKHISDVISADSRVQILTV